MSTTPIQPNSIVKINRGPYDGALYIPASRILEVEEIPKRQRDRQTSFPIYYCKVTLLSKNHGEVVINSTDDALCIVTQMQGTQI